MKKVKWGLLILGCAVLLAVLLTGCVGPRHVEYATPPPDEVEVSGAVRADYSPSQPIAQSKTIALSETQESITAFPDLQNGWPLSASPQSVVLTWDASPASAVSYYRIHFGTNGANYSFVTNVGLVLMQTVILPHRDQWFFAVTAVDANGLESPYSDQAQLDYQSYESRTGEENQTASQAR